MGCNGGGDDGANGGGGGSLWLIDATGAYRVRALACGGGKVENIHDKEDEQSQPMMVANIVNQKLLEIDFETITAREGIIHILRILTREDQEGENKESEEINDDSHQLQSSPMQLPPLVPMNSEMEIAITDSQNGKLQRLRLSSL